MSVKITKLSADEFTVRSQEYTYTCKLAGKMLQTDGYCLILTSAFVSKLAAMKIGDTIEWGPATSLNITKLSANEFFGREYPNDEEVKCVQTGEFLEIPESTRPLYLNPETISKLAQMKVGGTVTLYRVEDSEWPIDCPLCGSPMCGATTKEWKIKTGTDDGYTTTGVPNRASEKKGSTARLKTETNAAAMESRIREAFRVSTNGNNLGTHLCEIACERDYWWVTCKHCGREWEVVDANGGDSVDGFDFVLRSYRLEFCRE
jgi:hypothetical protein